MTTKRDRTADKAAGDDRNLGRWIGIGAAAGIGSAAIAAALIYANRARKPEETPKGPKDDSE